jgi:hypothetical protein
MVFFFVAALLGGGLATTAAAPLAEAGSYLLIFSIAALTAVPSRPPGQLRPPALYRTRGYASTR